MKSSQTCRSRCAEALVFSSFSSGFARLWRCWAVAIRSSVRLRECQRRQVVFSPATKALASILVGLMAVPPGLWACPPPPPPCQDPTVCCPSPEDCCNGGAGGGGIGSGGPYANFAGGAEDHNQNVGETATVLMSQMSASVGSTELLPAVQPGRLLSATPAFGRYNAANTDTGPLGPGWTHNYNVLLTKLGTNVLIKDWKGTERVFMRENGVWNGGANVEGNSSLSRDANGNFHWRLRHGTTYTFDDANGFRLATITDRQGNTLTLGYDENSRLTNAVDSTGRRVAFDLDANGRITRMTDPLDRVSTYSYDDLGQLTNVTDGLGFKAAYRYDTNYPGRLQAVINGRAITNIIYGYDGVGKVVATTNALGQATLYERDDVARAVKVTPPNGNVYTNFYNENGFVTRRVDAAGAGWFFRDENDRVTNHVDRLGHTNRYVYAEGSCACQISGELLQHVDPLGRVSLWSYDTNFHFATAFTNAAGFVWRWAYDERGNVTNATDALGHSTKYIVDAAGNVSQKIDALSRTTTFAYDQYGNQTNVTDALGHVTKTEYDLMGRLTRRVDPLNRTNAFTYDARDRLLAHVDALGNTDAWSYDGNGNRTGWTNALGYATAYAYDNADQLSSIILPETNSAFIRYAYDGNGNRVGQTNALGHAIRYGYDALNRLISTTNALGKAWTYGYDAEGRQSRTSDPNGHGTAFAYDAAGQLRFTTNALEQVVEFEYDLAGNRTNIIDARGNALGFGFDPLSRLTNLVYAANDSERFAYDPVGNLTNYTARSGDQIRYVYDPANRLTNKLFLGTSQAIRYAHDPLGRLTNVTWLDGQTLLSQVRFQYDPLGRLTNETQLVGTAASRSVAYEYDAAGRKTKMIYPDGSHLTYGYNANGWLTNISDNAGTVVRYEYDAAGYRTQRALENGTYTVYEYDAAGQMTNIVHRKADQSTISRYAYGYDDAGQRLWVKRANGRGDVYAYDATDQLTNVLYEALNPDTSPSAWTNEARYAFDPAGNRTSVTLTNSGTVNYTANALNQYTAVGSTTPTYDGNGNLTFDGTWTYTYDRENRLIQAVNGGTTISYTYDAFNRLVERAVGASVTRFYYDDRWRLIAEYDGNDALVRKYVYGPEVDEPVRLTDAGNGNTKYYYHAAALGTVTEITDTSGNLVEQYRYDVYGEATIYDSTFNPQPSTAIGNRLLFQGRDRDPATGLYNFRNRYYSPSLGRFVQVDPVRTESGLDDDLHGGGRANLYAFVYNAPTSFMDPFGLSVWSDIRAINAMIRQAISKALNQLMRGCGQTYCKTRGSCRACCLGLGAASFTMVELATSAGARACAALTHPVAITACALLVGYLHVSGMIELGRALQACLLIFA
jgi:RHS repeat-associated protein